jgi:hypothetical protein
MDGILNHRDVMLGAADHRSTLELASFVFLIHI